MTINSRRIRFLQIIRWGLMATRQEDKKYRYQFSNCVDVKYNHRLGERGYLTRSEWPPISSGWRHRNQCGETKRKN